MTTILPILLWIFLAAALLLVGCLLFQRARYFLHMLQLDSYANGRLVRWLAARPALRLLDLPRQLTLAVLALVLLVLTATVGAFPVQTIAAAALALASAVRFFLGSPQEEAKKPLVMTGRARRILAATHVVAAILLLAVFSLLHLGTTWTAARALLVALLAFAALLPVVAALSTLLANLCLVPVQAAINRSFVTAARRNLAKVNPTVVGITGSYGKTTTKYFLDVLVRDSIRTVKTPQSFNTLLGVSRVLNESLRPGVKLFIAELGAYRPGDIAELSALVHPTIGILTAIGPQHLERFGSVDAVERTKYELIEALPTNGLAVFNCDDPRCRRLADCTKKPVLRYGLDNTLGDLDVWAEDVRMTPDGMTFAIGTRQWGRTEVITPILGFHNVSNMLAATGVALHLGIPLDTLRRRLKSLEGAPHRLQLNKRADGVTIIDDSYNSNPVGAAQALRVLGQFTTGKRILITPGMVELGPAQEIENERFGELAAAECDFVFLVAGASSEAIHRGLRARGFPEDHIRALNDLSSATTELATIVRAGDVVLFANDLPDLYQSK